MGTPSLHNKQAFTSNLLDSIVNRLHEVDIAPEDALDDIVALDPETELGKAMTQVMVVIANLRLYDYYIGYHRKGNTIKLMLSGDAPAENVKDLVSQIEQSIETAPDEDEEAYIKASLHRTELNDKAAWVLDLSVYTTTPDEFSDIPVEMDVIGDVSVNDTADIEQPGMPAGTGQTVPEA